MFKVVGDDMWPTLIISWRNLPCRRRPRVHLLLRHPERHLHLQWCGHLGWQWRNMVGVTCVFMILYIFLKIMIFTVICDILVISSHPPSLLPGGDCQVSVTWWGGRTDPGWLRSRTPGKLKLILQQHSSGPWSGTFFLKTGSSKIPPTGPSGFMV